MPILSTTGAATAQAYGFGGGGLYKLVISTNQTDVDLRAFALTSGWNGTSALLAIIQSNTYVSSSSTSTPALTISGSFPAGVQLINNGYIVGRGGAGGSGSGQKTTGYPGNAGGLALSVLTNVIINNLGTIGGGGGGGGGGGALIFEPDGWGGGGGGGGRSGTTNGSGGAGGGYYEQNARPTQSGFDGTTSGAGAGGYGALTPNSQGGGGYGGTGGNWGSAGSSGQSGFWNGQGAPSGITSGGAGGAAGGAVTGNSYITWVATGTRLGSVS